VKPMSPEKKEPRWWRGTFGGDRFGAFLSSGSIPQSRQVSTLRPTPFVVAVFR